MSPSILYPLAAGVLLFLWNELAVHVVYAIRTAEFRRQTRERLQNPNSGAESIIVPTVATRARAIATLLSEIHQTAKSTQNNYQATITRSASSIFIAIISLSLTVTVFHSEYPAKLFFTYLDIEALALVPFCVRKGLTANAAWLKSRVLTERLRAYAFLSFLFPSYWKSPERGGITQSFYNEVERISRAVVDGPTSELSARLAAYWTDLTRELLSVSLIEHDLNPQIVTYFLNFRVHTQLLWFKTAKIRLERGEKWKAVLMLTLYVVTIFLAALKLSFILSPRPLATLIEFISGSLLVTLAVSAAVTAFYFGQNRRSLLHRYHAQERRIENWLRVFQTLRAQTIEEAASEYTTKEKDEIRKNILEFENLMVEELLDWIHISERDVIEFAP